MAERLIVARMASGMSESGEATMRVTPPDVGEGTDRREVGVCVRMLASVRAGVLGGKAGDDDVTLGSRID